MAWTVPIAPLTRPTSTQRLLVSMARADFATTSDCLQPSCIISWGLGCIGSSVGSYDGSDGLTTGLGAGHVVLNHSFNSRDEVEGRGEGREVLDSCVSVGHEVVPVRVCDLGIYQSQQDVSEQYLLWILASLSHDLVQNYCLVEGLVGCSPLV